MSVGHNNYSLSSIAEDKTSKNIFKCNFNSNCSKSLFSGQFCIRMAIRPLGWVEIICCLHYIGINRYRNNQSNICDWHNGRQEFISFFFVISGLNNHTFRMKCSNVKEMLEKSLSFELFNGCSYKSAWVMWKTANSICSDPKSANSSVSCWALNYFWDFLMFGCMLELILLFQWRNE